MAKPDEARSATAASTPSPFNPPARSGRAVLTARPGGLPRPLPLLLRERGAFDDEALADGLARSEPWATDALYRKLTPVVRRVVSRFSRAAPMDVDDLVQITFERVIRTIGEGKLDAGGNLSGWAATVATNAAIDHHRARARERRLFVESPELRESEGLEAFDEERLEARSAADELMEILGRMRPLDAEVLLLRHGFGCSVPEIAARLGASPTAAGSRLVRAQRELLRRAAGLRTQL